MNIEIYLSKKNFRVWVTGAWKNSTSLPGFVFFPFLGAKEERPQERGCKKNSVEQKFSVSLSSKPNNGQTCNTFIIEGYNNYNITMIITQNIESETN